LQQKTREKEEENKCLQEENENLKKSKKKEAKKWIWLEDKPEEKLVPLSTLVVNCHTYFETQL